MKISIRFFRFSCMLSMLSGVMYPNTYRICNMSLTGILAGYVNWFGKDNATDSFFLKPGESKDFHTEGRCLKGFYYNVNMPCNYPWSECSDGKTEGCCQYAGGGLFGDGLASCQDATYVWGSTAIQEAWGSVDGIMSGIDAVNAILACQQNNGYQTSTQCYCPRVGTGCSTIFNEVSCFFACAFGGQNQQEGGYHGGGEAMEDAKKSTPLSNKKIGDWTSILSDDDKKINLYVRQRKNAQKSVKHEDVPEQASKAVAQKITPVDQEVSTDAPVNASSDDTKSTDSKKI